MDGIDKIRKIEELDLKGKKVLVRVDFNVPIDHEGNITNDSRIRASLPTIQYILKQGGAVILMSHLGRPEGFEEKYSMKLIVNSLSSLLNLPVLLAPDCIGTSVEKMAQAMKPGEVLLLENLRFHRAEEDPEEDPSFARKLASLADIYIDDAFGTAHRAHSSTFEIVKYFPKKAAAGFLMEKEIHCLNKLILNPEKPFYAIIGGAKISSKLKILRSLLPRVEGIMLGGAMAFTFFKAQGLSIGNSLYESEMVEEANLILKLAKEMNVEIFLPIDIIIAHQVKKDSLTKSILSIEGIPPGFIGVDIGINTIKKFSNIIDKAKTIFWNGPMGIFEIPEFAKGTFAIAYAMANSKAITVVGGGESVAAIESLNISDEFTHVSTGGGASLEYIESGSLPGVQVLENAV